MPIRQRVTQKAPRFVGQKSGLPIESYGIDAAERIQNFFLDNGQLVKSFGQQAHASVLDGEPGGILSLHAFKDCVIAQRDDRISLNSNIVGTTTYTSQSWELASATKLFSAAWRDRIVLTNGQDAFAMYYPETTQEFKNFGLDPPEIATAAAPASYFTQDGAGNVNEGELWYMFSLYDANTNTESPCQGALPSQDGLFELSANGFLGPRPSSCNNSAGSTQKMKMAGNSLKAYVDAANELNGGRATHFIMYRAGPKVGGLYTTFKAVPLKDGGDYDGDVYLPIEALTGLSGAPGTGQINDFIDNTVFASLPDISPAENNSPPPTPARLLRALRWYRSIGNTTEENWSLSDYSGFRHIRFFRDQLFGIGARSFGFTINENISFGSDLDQKVTGKVSNFNSLLHGSEVYQPDYWPFRWEVGVGDGQEAIGLGVLGDVALLCFKEGSTYYLSGSAPQNYVVRIMDTQKGAVHQSTIQETSKGVISLDRSGFVLWNKIGQGEDISDDIRDVIESIDFTHAAHFYSCYDAKRQLYRCSVAVTGATVSNGITTPNLTCVLDLRSMQWSLEQGGEGLSRIQFSVSSSNATARAGTAVNVGRLYDLVGSKSNGNLYDYSLNSNVTNPGSEPIEAIWTSGTINFGDDQHMKRMDWIYLRAKSQTGWKINVEVIPDYDESRKFVLENWDVISSQSLWYSSDVASDGSLIWDSGDGSNDGGRWATDGLVRQVTKIPVKCLGYSFQIRVIHKETDATRYGFAIESVSAEGVQLGR